MSDLNNGAQCMECASVGRCAAGCVTKGGGAWIGQVTMAVGVTPCFLPNGARGVRVTSTSDNFNGRYINHTTLATPAAVDLVRLIQDELAKP